MSDGRFERCQLIEGEVRNRVLYITVIGNLSSDDLPALEETHRDLDLTEIDGAELDLERCEFIDSTGLRGMLALSRKLAKAAMPPLVLRNPSAGVTRLLGITGTTDQFTIVELSASTDSPVRPPRRDRD